MARRRTIYSRKRNRTGRRVVRGTAAAIIVVAVLYFAVAGGLGTWIADKFIAPNMGGGAGEGGDGSGAVLPTAQPQSDTPAATPTPTPETSEEIVFEAMPLYAIQLGAFANAANAEAEAERYQLRGAAGYIYQDEDRARVLASAYHTRAEAENVREQLISQQGVENYVLEIFTDVGDVTLRITAPAERIAALRAGIAGWRSALEKLEAIASKLDIGELGPSLAQEELRDIAIALEAQRAAMTEGAQVEGSSAIDEMQNIMRVMMERLTSLSNQQDASAMAISSQIKYTYVDSMIRYGQALRMISTAEAR